MKTLARSIDEPSVPREDVGKASTQSSCTRYETSRPHRSDPAQALVPHAVVNIAAATHPRHHMEFTTLSLKTFCTVVLAGKEERSNNFLATKAIRFPGINTTHHVTQWPSRPMKTTLKLKHLWGCFEMVSGGFSNDFNFLYFLLTNGHYCHDHYVAKLIFKTAERRKMSHNVLDPADQISVVNFLSTFKVTCDRKRVLERAAIWVLAIFISNPTMSKINARTGLQKSLNRSLDGALDSYCYVAIASFGVVRHPKWHRRGSKQYYKLYIAVQFDDSLICIDTLAQVVTLQHSQE